ncbi:hypothetical protein ACQQ2N_01115 [Dokdonella sp. MW10]|uniref:hypothetical protein n=1 Tax=Dokdonella sp. MW10 TaxID=2992926 RepID=UPI003F7D5D35
MTAPAVLLLGLFVAFSIVTDKLDQRKDRLNKVRSEKMALYKARLVPCKGDFYPPDVEPLPLGANEVGVEIIPSFSTSIGIRISETSMRSYTGELGFNYPPPPPPPNGSSAYPNREQEARPTFELSQPLPINTELGKHIVLVLGSEIEIADADPALGLDGTTYIFRYRGKCATAWSPQPGTRAEKLVRLVEELAQMSQTGSASNRTEIRDLLIELDSDKSQLDG